LLGVIDESLMYRCDTPIIHKVTNYNWPESDRTTESIIRIDKMKAYDDMWGAVFPAHLMDWKVRRKIRIFIMAVPNVDYSKYALQPGQECTCDKHA
jgi:hypothetical protein